MINIRYTNPELFSKFGMKRNILYSNITSSLTMSLFNQFMFSSNYNYGKGIKEELEKMKRSSKNG